MFKGLATLANLGGLLKQAQEMGSKFQAIAQQLQGQKVSGSSGGGMVTIEANGLGEVQSCRIDPSLTDREMLEDLLPAAVNQALAKAKELHAQAMQSAAAGLKNPQ